MVPEIKIQSEDVEVREFSALEEMKDINSALVTVWGLRLQEGPGPDLLGPFIRFILIARGNFKLQSATVT